MLPSRGLVVLPALEVDGRPLSCRCVCVLCAGVCACCVLVSVCMLVMCRCVSVLCAVCTGVSASLQVNKLGHTHTHTHMYTHLHPYNHPRCQVLRTVPCSTHSTGWQYLLPPLPAISRVVCPQYGALMQYFLPPLPAISMLQYPVLSALNIAVPGRYAIALCLPSTSVYYKDHEASMGYHPSADHAPTLMPSRPVMCAITLSCWGILRHCILCYYYALCIGSVVRQR